MLTVTALLLLAAFILACVAATGRNTLWIAVVLLTIAGLLEIFPR